MNILTSPFGAPSHLVARISVDHVKMLYLRKCSLDISPFLPEIDCLELYQCSQTGYLYWQPDGLEGNEAFYEALSSKWPNYYQKKRWEYSSALSYARTGDRCLEIGCGQGWFLKELEHKNTQCIGLELNKNAINNKVCSSVVLNETIQAHATKNPQYDSIFIFQVLEHIAMPAEFISSALTCLRPGGSLVISTPNYDYGPHIRMEDAFNFPPHHVGNYTKSVYLHIAELFELECKEIAFSSCEFSFPEFSTQTTQRLDFKLFRFFGRRIANYILERSREPGHTILCTLIKPA